MIHIPRLRVLWLAALTAACIPVAVHAQDSLFQQGRGLLEGVLQGQSGGSSLGDAEIGAGLREALKVGTERVTMNLGQLDGYNGNPDVRMRCPRLSRACRRPSRWRACPASPTISSCA